jgi:hypothetical protein
MNGVKNAKAKTDGFRTWDEGDIAQFEARHPVGTKERLALALLLYTVQPGRRGADGTAGLDIPLPSSPAPTM